MPGRREPARPAGRDEGLVAPAGGPRRDDVRAEWIAARTPPDPVQPKLDARKTLVKRSYLDHAATTPLRDEVRESMAPFERERFANPASHHWWGRAASAALEDSRARVAALLGARSSEIVFASGGTEAANLAVAGCARAGRENGRRPLVVTSSIEHPAVLAAAAAVAAGGRTERVGVDRDGVLDLGALERLIERRPALVSVMWVNNEVGTILPVEEVARLTRRAGVPLHTDAVQAAGRIPVRVDSIPVDLLTLSGHKIYGPKGSAILFVREGTAVAPILFGGGQERALRPGTVDVARAVGLATALDLAIREREREAERLSSLRRSLERRLARTIAGSRIHGREAPRVPDIASFGIRGVDQEALLDGLDLEGVACSGGSACSSGSRGPSHVIQAMYGGQADGWASLRFSLGRLTGPAEIDHACRATAAVVERLRR